MTCQELDERLDDWLDGALPAAEAARVEAHLAGCPSCRESERRLRQLLAHAAALPRSASPSRDLWPEVERRIARAGGWAGFFGWGPSLGLAAAAIVLAAVAALLWQTQTPAAVQTVEMPVGPAFEAASAQGAPVSDPVLAQAEREYEAAANTLLGALQQRQSALTPEDLARIQANLRVIDRALAEVRLALAKDPGNPELNRMLVATHRKKVDVLRRVVRLSTAL